MRRKRGDVTQVFKIINLINSAGYDNFFQTTERDDRTLRVNWCQTHIRSKWKRMTGKFGKLLWPAD